MVTRGGGAPPPVARMASLQDALLTLLSLLPFGDGQQLVDGRMVLENLGFAGGPLHFDPVYVGGPGQAEIEGQGTLGQVAGFAIVVLGVGLAGHGYFYRGAEGVPIGGDAAKKNPATFAMVKPATLSA